jgi:hypothetical protein
VESDYIEEGELFRAVQRSHAHALLIGRQALIMLGLPVLTRDFDYWIRAEDVEAFNAALEPLGLHPNCTAEQARGRGRYVLENGERVDVMLVREARADDGTIVRFDALWADRRSVRSGSIEITMPSIDGLILTKRLGGRPKDAEDIRMLRVLASDQDSSI